MTAHTKMMKDESDETQNILAGGYSGIQNAITAHTNTMKSESDETQQKLASIVSQLESIAHDIELNTSGDATNADNITRAIQNLRLIVNP